MRLLSHDEDQLDLRFSVEELVLLRDLLEQHCNGRQPDISLYEAETLLRVLDSTLDRLEIERPAD